MVLVSGSAIGIIFWFAMIFFTIFMGGINGPPNFQREVSPYCISIIVLGLIGSGIGFITAIKLIRNKKEQANTMLIPAVLFMVAGSVPFYFMELYQLGAIALLIGILPSTIYIIINQNLKWERSHNK